MAVRRGEHDVVGDPHPVTEPQCVTVDERTLNTREPVRLAHDRRVGVSGLSREAGF